MYIYCDRLVYGDAREQLLSHCSQTLTFETGSQYIELTSLDVII